MIVKELVAKLGLDIDEAAFAKADALMSGIAKGFLAFGAAAAAGIAVGAAAIAKSTADAADHIKKLAQSTGINSIALQEMGYAADLAGVSVDEMAKGMQFMAKKGVKDVKEGMLALADQMATMPSDGAKVELAAEKLGSKLGPRLIPLLTGGRKALEALALEAHELGVVFDETSQNAAEEFNDNLTRLSKSFTGLKNVLGNALIPVFDKWVRMTLSFFKSVRTNWLPIMEKLTLALKGVAFVLGGVVLAALFANIGAIVSTVGWYVALGIASAVAAAKAAAAWLIAAGPMVALVGVLALILAGFEDVYTFLTGGDSLIGELGPKWSKFLDSFTAPNAADPWWLAALKTGLRYITDIQGSFEKLEAWFNATKIGKYLSGQVSPGPTAAPTGEPTGPNLIGNLMNSLGATPSAPTMIRGSSGGGSSVSAPVHITVVPGPGMNEHDLARKVGVIVEEHSRNTLRQAAAGIE